MDRKELLGQIKAKEEKRDSLFAKGNEMTTDDVQSVKALNGEIKGLQDKVDLLDQTAGLKGWGNEPQNRPELPTGTKDAEILGFMHGGFDEYEFATTKEAGQFKKSLKLLSQSGAGIFGAKTWEAIGTKAYHDSFWKYVTKGRDYLGSGELKDLSEGLDAQGGYLAPPEMIARIVGRSPAPTRVAGLVQTVTTGRDALTMPKVNYNTDDIYSTGFRVTWTGEIPSSDTEHRVSDDDLFGQHRIDIHTGMMSTAVTNDMLEDSGFDLQGWLIAKLNETADLVSDQVAMSGTGVGQAFGMLNEIGTGADQIQRVNSGHASQLTADGLIALDYSLPEQYITSRSLAYVMNRTNTAQAIAKLKDAQNRYLFNMGGASDGGLQGVRPDTLLGKLIAYTAFAPNVAASAYPIVFGDLTGYLRALRLGLTIQVLRETGAKRNKIELVGRLRLGGKTIEPFKLKAQYVSA